MNARAGLSRRPRTLLLSAAVAAAITGAALAPQALAATTSSSTSATATAPAAPADGTAPTPPTDGTSPTPPADGTAPTPPEGGPAGGPGGHGGPGGGPGGEATITAVDDDSITVSSESGTETTYTITSDTTVSLGGGPDADGSAAVSDLEVGQHVHVRTDAAPATEDGTTDGSTDGATSDEATATAIEVHLPSLRGTVAEVTGSGFTLVDRDGFTRTVTLADGATVTDAGAESSLSDLAAGDVVTAVGEVDADGTTLLASAVRTGETAPAGPRADGAAPTAPSAPSSTESELNNS